jgi:uncharacterized protein (DUF302 family)
MRELQGRSRAFGALLVCVATVAVTLASVWMVGKVGVGKPQPIRVDVASQLPFDQVRSRLEASLQSAGFTIFDPAGATGTAPAEVERRLGALADKEGLMILGESDVGRRQSRILGKTVRSKLYMIGNPLIASRMIAIAPAASLYVPLRVLVFEDGTGVTRIVYDRPSDLLGTLGDEKVNEVARMLDGKLYDLAEKAAGEVPVTGSVVKGSKHMIDTRFTVEHVRVTADRPFAEVKAAFERRLGKFDPSASKSLAEGGDPQAARAKIEEMAGPSGFMLFGSTDHGSLLRIVGRQGKAVQFVVGNPLYALEMTRHAIGAALYAPLRVLIYEDEAGKTCVEYDRPSSLFGQFGDGRVDEMAASLDKKLAELVAEATK